jgi:hypothetical protein
MRQELKMLTDLCTGFEMDWLADGLAVRENALVLG